MKTACISIALAAVMAPIALAAWSQEVGLVRLVEVYGYETPPASSRGPIYVRDPVVADTVLETVADGRLDVRFVDDTQLIVGPSSTVKVDRFVYDPNRGAGETSLNVGKGVMRFVTGRMASGSYRVTTPAATLGVRGTDFIVAVAESGATAVSVVSGVVDMLSASGATAAIDAGFTGTTDGADVSVAPTVGVPALAALSFGFASPGVDSQADGDGGESEGEGD